MHARGSGAGESRETLETRAAARQEKRVPFPFRAISHARSRLPGHARGHLRVSRFARRTTGKRETARSLKAKGFSQMHFATNFIGYFD